MIVFNFHKRKAAERSQIMREICIRRDGPCCVYCGINLLNDPRLFSTMVLDHFIPRRLGGSDRVENRVLSCVACDRLKSCRCFRDLDHARRFIAGAYSRVIEDMARREAGLATASIPAQAGGDGGSLGRPAVLDDSWPAALHGANLPEGRS